MNWLRTLGQLILGDLRERTRRYSFLWILIGTTFFGYLVITGKYTLVFVGYQPQYNAAWVGSLMSSFCAIMTALLGFYLIKNTVERDRRTGVGQILASTPMRGTTYMLAKFVSNYLVLFALTVVLVGAAVVMQFINDTPGGFSPVELLTPFLVITLPVLGLVAGVALLFESIRWLRGTVGNILYLLAFEAVLVIAVVAEQPFLDLAGFYRYTTSMKAAILALYPDVKIATQMGLVGIFEGMSSEKLLPFTWSGIDWSIEMFTSRLAYIATGLAITGVAALCFDRFDPARIKLRKPKKKKEQTASSKEIPRATVVSSVSIAKLAPVTINFSPVPLILAELRLMLKGYHWSWYLIAAALVATQLAAPYEIVRQFVLPAAWIWPLAIWSAMGTREKRFNTEQLFNSSPSPLTRQFPAAWIAGLAITLALAGGMMIRTVVAGEWSQLLALVIAALFVPTLALTLGSITGTRKFFEVVYLMGWYIGSVNKVWAFDFIGVTDRALDAGMPYLVLGATALMLPVGFLIRSRRLTRM